MNQNYIVDKLTLSDLTKSGKIIIPNFQRGIVWNKEHRKDFIETVKSGDPFGVVLVSQEKNTDPYILIDGLQRLSTLKAYMNNPLEFIDENDKFIDKDKLHNVFVTKYEIKGMQLPKEERLEKEKKTFLKKMISKMKESGKTPKATELWPYISEEVLGVATSFFGLYTAFDEFYSSFLENLQLPDIIIHAIVYTGPQDRLPTVFENLNTTSVTLSKYEVFSSKWPNTKILVNDDSIIKNVWSKYAKLKQSSKFEVETTEESLREEGITLFEYCFAFSELLNDKDKEYSFMFSKEKKSTDPTGFDILALACGTSVNKADDLWKDEYLGGSSGAFLVQLKDALLDCVSFVSRSVSNWVYDLKGTSIKNSSLYQIYHLIIVAFKHLYNFDAKTKTLSLKDSKEVEQWKMQFNQYAYKWYLYHHITGFWNLNRQVNDLKRLLETEEGTEIYTTNISRQQWDTALKDYINQVKPGATSRNIDNDIKLILNYLYKMMIKEDKNRENYFTKTDSKGNVVTFDIEHIVPYAKFAKFDEELPVSALGNLCYLPVKDNRSKRDKTIYDYAEDRPSLTYDPEFLKIIDYPSREELEFKDCSFDEFKQPYLAMVEKREANIVEKFLDLVMKF